MMCFLSKFENSVETLDQNVVFGVTVIVYFFENLPYANVFLNMDLL